MVSAIAAIFLFRAPQTCNVSNAIVRGLPGVALQSVRCDMHRERTCEASDEAVPCGVTCETALTCAAVSQRMGRVGCWDAETLRSIAVRKMEN